MRIPFISSCLVILLLLATSCRKDNISPKGTMQLTSVTIGEVTLSLHGSNVNLPVDKPLTVAFASALDTTSVRNSITVKKDDNTISSYTVNYTNDLRTAEIHTVTPLINSSDYTLSISSGLKGAAGETFPGISYSFTTEAGKLKVQSITLNGNDFSTTARHAEIDYAHINFVIRFSNELNPSSYQSSFHLTTSPSVTTSLSADNKTVTITNNTALKGYSKYFFTISNDLTSSSGFPFDGFTNSFYTSVDSTLKFPLISDDQLLTLIQQQTFKYFYDYAHPACGMARERLNSADVVTTGGSGFGVMALIVGMERNFITRNEGITRLDKILHFLETCDRFHGAWPHWLNGNTGKTVPFSQYDDGGDLVETSYMIQGLLTMRQYLNPADATENSLIGRINDLCSTVEYDWFTNGGQNSLFWHWSPTTGWLMNFRIEGYNETLITYVVAATSVTHPIQAIAYNQGYARSGAIVNGNSYYGIILPLGEPYGGPLFFSQYSYLGLDPRNLSDMYANYWEQNVNQSLINHAYCKANPKKYVGYGDQSWGLTASDNPWGYSAHSPTNDLGVISPTAAVSALPYTPVQSMDAIRRFYYILGDKLWGPYGFYDAFDVTDSYWGASYISIDQGPEICMIENYRTHLLWNLFMSCPEVSTGLTKLGFSY